MTTEDFSLMLFKSMANDILTGLEDVISSAHEDGLSETKEYKDFIQNLSLLCSKA